MTAVAPTVRDARVQLGLSLLAREPDCGEGIEHLRRAMTEPGDRPPEWEIRRALALASEQGGDPITALRELVAATTQAPAEAGDEPAAHGLRLLETAGSHLAHHLTDSEVAAMVERVRAGEASRVAVRFAARLALQRGDVELTRQLLETRAVTEAVEQADLQAARAVAQAHDHLAAGDPSAARAATERPGLPADPAVVAVRALSLYALGDDEAALAALSGAAGSYDGSVVRALLLLRQAADLSGDERRAVIEQAAEAAGQAARLEPMAADALILRAQAMLEGATGIDEGRHLLRSGLRRLSQELDSVSWYQVQERRRDDPSYAYFRIEVSAARGRSDDVLAAASEIGTEALPAHQAAAHEIAAQVLEEQGERADAAVRYRSAATLFRSAGDRRQALINARRALPLAADPVLAGELASMLWESTFDDNFGEQPELLLDEGLRSLDQADALVDEASCLETCYGRGLLLRRRVELETRSSALSLWEPLPWLLARHLAAPDGYVAVHTAWALNNADLDRAALHFAEQAYARMPEDHWAREVVIANRFNWAAQLDPDSRALLASLPEDQWRVTVDAYDRLLRWDVEGLRSRLDLIGGEWGWAREIRAHALTRCGEMDGAREAFRRLLEDRADYSTAADAAMMLYDLAAARELIDEGESRGAISAERAAFRRAMLDLVDGGDHGSELEVVNSYLQRVRRPFRLSTLARIVVPTAIAMHADRADCVQAFAQVGDAAEQRLRQLPSVAPLTADFEEPLDHPPDEALTAMVKGLLEVEQHLVAGDDHAALARLGSLPDPDRRALSLTLGRIAQRVS